MHAWIIHAPLFSIILRNGRKVKPSNHQVHRRYLVDYANIDEFLKVHCQSLEFCILKVFFYGIILNRDYFLVLERRTFSVVIPYNIL